MTMEEIAPYLEALKEKPIAECPLWGIPFAIKDNIDLKGVPTTAGSPEYAYQPEQTAEIVRRVLAAGAIPLGKPTWISLQPDWWEPEVPMAKRTMHSSRS